MVRGYRVSGHDPRGGGQVYDDAELDQIVTPTARPVVVNIAENCLYTRPKSSSVPGSLAVVSGRLPSPPGVAHLEAGHEAVPEVAAWIADRFAGEPATIDLWMIDRQVYWIGCGLQRILPRGHSARSGL